MATRAITTVSERFPSLLDDFFKPWNGWLDPGGSVWNKMHEVPAVNIRENEHNYEVALAAPGLKKEDFRIDMDANRLTISAAKEEDKTTEETAFTRREYNYSSFSRSFTIPENVLPESIQAFYENGVLRMVMPKTKKPVMDTARHITVQ